MCECFTSPPTQYRLYGGRFLQVHGTERTALKPGPVRYLNIMAKKQTAPTLHSDLVNHHWSSTFHKDISTGKTVTEDSAKVTTV